MKVQVQIDSGWLDHEVESRHEADAYLAYCRVLLDRDVIHAHLINDAGKVFEVVERKKSRHNLGGMCTSRCRFRG